jgi:hypothetical protein
MRKLGLIKWDRKKANIFLHCEPYLYSGQEKFLSSERDAFAGWHKMKGDNSRTNGHGRIALMRSPREYC